jgi:hypothetical protein
VEEIAQAIRKHWMVESYHWHLDVTFREDGNHTLEVAAILGYRILSLIVRYMIILLNLACSLGLQVRVLCFDRNSGYISVDIWVEIE